MLNTVEAHKNLLLENQAENRIETDSAEHISDETIVKTPTIHYDAKVVKKNNFGIMGLVSW